MSTAITVDPSTRDRIVSRAAPLFADRGFAGVSVRDIAEAVGIKAASLYNHYPDKESLYVAVLEQVFSRRAALVEEALTATGAPRERLKALVSALVQATAGDPTTSRLLQRELLDGDMGRFERMTREVFGRPFTHMTRLLVELAPGSDGAQTAAYLISLIHGYCVFAPILPALDASLSADTSVLADNLAEELLGRMERARP
ncbi:MAG: TetR/AcrR family transcriptional regulator [Sphingomonadales bacterium]